MRRTTSSRDATARRRQGADLRRSGVKSQPVTGTAYLRRISCTGEAALVLSGGLCSSRSKRHTTPALTAERELAIESSESKVPCLPVVF